MSDKKMPDAYKHHLALLPTPYPGCIPDWQPEGDSDFCLLIPLFSFFRNGELSLPYIHGAACVLETWKRHSDAQDYNVPCYIWLEDLVADDVIPYLTETLHVPESCIVTGSAGPCTGIGQCMGPIFDEAFDRYKYKVIIDSEMLIVSPPGEKLRFFETLSNGVLPGVGVSYKWVQQTPIRLSQCKYWLRNHLPEGVSQFDDAVFQENPPAMEVAEEAWLADVKDLAGSDVYDFFSIPGLSFDFLLSAMRIFDKSQMDMDWWAQALNKLSDDEASIAVWEKMSEDNKVWGLSEIQPEIRQGIAHDMKPYDYFMPVASPFIFNFCNSVMDFMHSFFHNSRNP